ncbi:hypothetical protein AJ80_00051 [Polytolypa hystricis UAMH7299]|uniref:Swi5-dependent recombination DNA repair protein 1 n=1 Tax=Polytolypa hystricis (strain UAMH7299) TaxID=1447883 RepID=A0A2B7Z478_POLH7|nr:hypothetical protein AJ80_00051 [Polytolypa hystricis UAMH7299]
MVSSSLPASKRRRLDDAATTLSKPFKSPMRKHPLPQQQQQQDSPQADRSTDTLLDNENVLTSETPSATRQLSTPQKAAPAGRPDNVSAAFTPPSRRFTPLTPTANHHNKKGSSSQLSSPLKHQYAENTKTPTTHTSPPHPSTSTSTSTQNIRTLKSQQTRLTSHASNLRNTLDTLIQALTLTSSTKDSDLEALIGKWKLVAREAVEELFGVAKESVEKMGGVKGWRESVRRGVRARNMYWDERADGYGAIEGQEGEGEGREEVERRRGEGEGEGGEDGGGDDDEGFTMEMMLKSLNIELHLLGYDKVNQQWID